MPVRIYADEAGTHGDDWLVIGMLFVPDHGPLHNDLCDDKVRLGYFNTSPKKKCRFKEVHLSEFRSKRDVEIGKMWVDTFVKHQCFFRAIVVEWSIWEPRFFGDPFEPEALKKRRAYKKWAEMLLHPELKEPSPVPISSAGFYLDRLRILYGYDVLEHLKDRFTRNYEGHAPYITKFQPAESWRDANQCLQLCDLLTGCVYQNLVPSRKAEKLEVRDYCASAMRAFGVTSMTPGYWRGYAANSLRKHFPKFSLWFWSPDKIASKERRRKRR